MTTLRNHLMISSNVFHKKLYLLAPQKSRTVLHLKLGLFMDLKGKWHHCLYDTTGDNDDTDDVTDVIRP